ncbi:hypothetical protein R3P38DRAFT_3615695 [Favolaschia claudopus]|uniref:DUF6818 domain-containing protein n=1 Tax=Favolaschia claudopus TaxID=2862362 RepID=A0AAW0A5C4_9AGAR
MSDPPSRPPFTPIRIPELAQDENGNSFYLNPDGQWVPYHGPLPVSSSSSPSFLSLHLTKIQQPPPLQQLPLAPETNDLNRGGPHSPIEHAFQPPQYHFSLRPVEQPIPIDPALQPHSDLVHTAAPGSKPAEKAGTRRRKGKDKDTADGKGKKRQHVSSGSDNDSEPAAKRGRPAGSSNYAKEDVRKMFEIIRKVLPVGQKGWKEVERLYNEWARANGRAERPPKALENKYKQYLRQKKPTGSASCPPEVKQAHEIEDLINARVGTRDVSDSEFDDASNSPSSDNDDDVVRTATARRAPTPPLPSRKTKSRARGSDLANTLATAFDPAAQQAREDARARRSFENTQIITLSQQLRDSQATAETLRTQVNLLQNRIHDLERNREREELRREMMEFARAESRGHSRTPFRRPPGYRSRKREPGIDRSDGQIRCEKVYSDGGRMTYFVSDPSTDEYYNSDEENHPPYAYDRKAYDTFDSDPRPSRLQRPVSRRRSPTPGPSRWAGRLHSPSPPRASTSAAPPAPVTGNAVELVVTPQQGPSLSFVVSPTKPSQFDGTSKNT